MKIFVKEKLSPHKYKTPEGYLICVDSILARTGKQKYLKRELFECDDDSVVEVDRKPEDVFSAETLASFENKPICIEHPDEAVNSTNYSDYSVGFVRDIKRGVAEGQDVMLGTLVITDQKAIEDIENGNRIELSCGYNCDVVDEDKPYQTNIRGNHIALCECGRAGIARIVDSVPRVLKVGEKIMTEDGEREIETISTNDKGEVVIKFKDKLIQSNSEEAFEKNIATEVELGKPVKQAVAIAYNIKRANDMKILKLLDIIEKV